MVIAGMCEKGCSVDMENWKQMPKHETNEQNEKTDKNKERIKQNKGKKMSVLS